MSAVPTETVIIQEHTHPLHKVAVDARVSSAEMQGHWDTQAERLVQSCAARGHSISHVVKEIASGVHEHRPRFFALVADTSITRMVVEQKARATRFGFTDSATLLEKERRGIEVVNPAKNSQEVVMSDLAAIMYSLSAQLYGPRRAKCQIDNVLQDLTQDEREGNRDAPGGTTSD